MKFYLFYSAIKEKNADCRSGTNMIVTFQHIAKYRQISLGGFHYNWISPYVETLVELDLNNNNLTSLPLNIPWCLPSIVCLNLANNNLVKFQGPEGSIECQW